MRDLLDRRLEDCRPIFRAGVLEAVEAERDQSQIALRSIVVIATEWQQEQFHMQVRARAWSEQIIHDNRGE